MKHSYCAIWALFLCQINFIFIRINLSIVHGYRDPVTKKTKHKVIKNLGYVDEYLDCYEDPVTHFKEVVRIRTQEMEEEEAGKEILLGSVYADELMDENEDAMYHLGFLPLSAIYHELKLDQFLINRQRSKSMDYSLNDVMQLLVYTRVLTLGSKRASFLQKENLAGSFKCDWFDVYRALNYFAAFREDLLLHLHEQVRINYKRKTNVVFYDVTNYYFEIDQEIESLKRYQSCLVKDNVFRLTYYDHIIRDIGDALNLTLNRRFLKTGSIRQLVADSKNNF